MFFMIFFMILGGFVGRNEVFYKRQQKVLIHHPNSLNLIVHIFYTMPPKKPTNRPKLQFEVVSLNRGEVIEITPDMIIGDVVLAYPETLPILKKVGIHCVGCYASTFESIQEGLLNHGIDPIKVCKQLNLAIRGKHQGPTNKSSK